MKECYFYEKLKNKNLRCQTCAHHCLIEPASRGICGVRENRDGKLYLLVYGQAVAANIDPIEKKPFFHFLPGSYSFSVATIGCNFKCLNCQNFDISQASKQPGISSEQIQKMGFDLAPEKIVQEALAASCPSISYTYTEPTIFLEYALETMKLAHQKGLKNNWVSNGFMTKETLDLAAPYLDAINVDLKSFSDEFYIKNCGARLQPVLDSLKRIKEKNIWLEITTLVIPTLSDSQEMFYQIAQFIKNELGPETPWHISRFSGWISWKLKHLPDTPIETLKRACQIGLESGLKYVYSGNVPGLASEDTYCPKCKELNIDRASYQIKRLDKNGKCHKCGEVLDLIL